MKTTVSIIAIMALFTTTAAIAAPAGMARGSMGGYQQGYSGTAAGKGGYTSKTGMVKERSDEENHMTGEMKAGDNAPSAGGEGTEPEDGDIGGETDMDEGERDD